MSTKHILYLDSVRGIACMIVVYFHTITQIYPGILSGEFTYEQINPNNIMFYPPFSLALAGTASVCLFFVLSGFVLSQRFLGEREMQWKIIEAITKRPVRLVGVIFFTLLPMFYFLFTADFWCNRLWVDYDVYLKFFAHIAGSFVTMKILTIDSLRNPVLWSIDIELWGSFLTFGLCLLVGNWSKLVRLVIWISLMLWFKDTYYVAFMFGILIADLHKNWNVDWFIKHKNAISYVLIIPAIILSAYPIYYIPKPQFLANVKFIQDGYLMLGAMLMFICIMCNDRVKRILEFKLLVFVGGISYSVYVLHLLILNNYLVPVANLVRTNFSTNIYLSFILIVAAVFIVVIFLSWLVDVCVDKPCIKFAAWFGRKITKEIQVRLEVLRNMIKALKMKNHHKCGHAQDSLALIRVIETDDKLVPVSEQNDAVKLESHIKEDRKKFGYEEADAK